MAHKKKLYRLREGVSLLISLGLVTVIVLFGLIVSNVVVTSIRQSANVNRANEAYYATEGALEQGLMENRNQNAGYSGPATDISYNGNVSAKYKVQGQVPMNVQYENPSNFDGMYGIPTPGTGDAGADCDILKAWNANRFDYDPQTDTYSLSSAGSEAADHPCNWNKIKVGDVVSIPLYVNDPANCTTIGQDGICNPADLQMTDLRLRVRTPCSDGEEFCSPTARYELDDTFGDAELACDLTKVDGCGDTIISWSISGTNLTGNTAYEFRPLAVPDPLFYDATKGKRLVANSEIYETLINKANTLTLGTYDFGCDQYCVLSEQRGGKDIIDPNPAIRDKIALVLHFLTNSGSTFGLRTGDAILHKPVMKLAVINSLRDKNSGDPIPYLEYQLITDINSAYSPTDTSQTITAEGYSGEFKQILEVKQPQESGLLEYVIQQ